MNEFLSRTLLPLQQIGHYERIIRLGIKRSVNPYVLEMMAVISRLITALMLSTEYP